MMRPEFYLRGSETIAYWVSCGVGVDPATTHAFRSAFHDVIVGKLKGADIGYAKDTLSSCVAACTALACGRTSAELLQETADNATFIITKALFDGQRAIKLRNLMRQDAIPQSFRNLLQASAYDERGQRPPQHLRESVRRFKDAALVRPREQPRSASRSPNRTRREGAPARKSHPPPAGAKRGNEPYRKPTEQSS
jgi:hypothetical protein